MKTFKFGTTFLLIILSFLTNCNTVKVSKADVPPSPIREVILQKKSLNEIDLTEIKHTVPQGRAQDGGLEDENFNKLSITDDLIAHGTNSIPFLIDKLDNETKMERRAVDFWYQVYVGDMALIILDSFFTKSDAVTSTIPGFGWDEFLERGNDKNSPSEAILRKYIKKHGRRNIKERWQKMWNENKDKIYWDETERCFNLR